MGTAGPWCHALAIGLAVCACSSRERAAKPAQADKPPPSAPAPRAVVADDAAVKARLDVWVKAQNSQDYAAYEQLYAAKFEGIKRVGPRAFRYDRKGWLADRKRMFAKPITVMVRSVAIRAGAGSVVVDLIQTFTRGRFEDVGPKRLVLVRAAGALQIAREEMLMSVLREQAPAVKPRTTFLVIELQKKAHVILAAGTADAAFPIEERDLWSDQPAQELPVASDAAYSVASRAARQGPVSAKWRGRALKVYDGKGRACDATVGKLAWIAGGRPHENDAAIWAGYPDGYTGEAKPPGRMWSDAERADAVWNLSQPHLVGELAVNGACDAVIAVDPATHVALFAHQRPDARAEAAAIAAFRNHPSYQELQRRFTDDLDGQGEWAKQPGVVAFAAGGRRFVEVSASSGESCADMLDLALLFEDKGGTLTPAFGPTNALIIDLIADTDGDGVIELVGSFDPSTTPRALFVLDRAAREGTTTALVEVTFPFYGCGC